MSIAIACQIVRVSDPIRKSVPAFTMLVLCTVVLVPYST